MRRCEPRVKPRTTAVWHPLSQYSSFFEAQMAEFMDIRRNSPFWRPSMRWFIGKGEPRASILFEEPLSPSSAREGSDLRSMGNYFSGLVILAEVQTGGVHLPRDSGRPQLVIDRCESEG